MLRLWLSLDAHVLSSSVEDFYTLPSSFQELVRPWGLRQPNAVMCSTRANCKPEKRRVRYCRSSWQLTSKLTPRGQKVSTWTRCAPRESCDHVHPGRRMWRTRKLTRMAPLAVWMWNSYVAMMRECHEVGEGERRRLSYVPLGEIELSALCDLYKVRLQAIKSEDIVVDKKKGKKGSGSQAAATAVAGPTLETLDPRCVRPEHVLDRFAPADANRFVRILNVNTNRTWLQRLLAASWSSRVCRGLVSVTLLAVAWSQTIKCTCLARHRAGWTTTMRPSTAGRDTATKRFICTLTCSTRTRRRCPTPCLPFNIPPATPHASLRA